MSSEQDLEVLAAELQKQLNTLLVDATKDTVQAVLQQIPVILGREDWELETKQEALQLIQTALVTPFISALTTIALSSQMELRDLLYHVGDAWDQLRAQHMSKVALDIINGKKKEEGT
jgi:hypothetical protein